jgi:cyclopropane fatty-acyl-phospholipid synthase-like methyltransferase
LASELCLKQGQQLLDIPCGFGRHAVEFSKRGYKVTCIDISHTFISALIQKIKSHKLSVEAIQADILIVNLSQNYSVALKGVIRLLEN